MIQLPSQYRVYPNSLSVAEAKGRALTLNMSRALGHLMLSQHGVTHTPDCAHISLPYGHASNASEDEKQEQAAGSDSGSGSEREVWMLLASDGLWDVMDVDDVRAMIDQQRRDQRRSRHESKGGDGTSRCHKGLQRDGMCLECVCCLLLQSCEAKWQTRGGGDNITIVLAQLTVPRT